MIPEPRHCPECGSDRYLEGEHERLQRRCERVTQEALRQAGRDAREMMKLRLELAGAEESRRSLQRKVAKQRSALNKLEAKLRALGTRPYEREGTP